MYSETNGSSQQDPFIELYYKNQKMFTTSVKDESGAQAKWDEYIDFDYDNI